MLYCYKQTLFSLKTALFYFFTITLLLSLTGCYCFKTTSSNSSVRNLDGTNYSVQYEPCNGNDKSVLVNAYYGFPSSEKQEYTDRFSTQTTAHQEFSTIGVFGVRVEKYILSFKIPYKVLGLGIDYSQAYFELNQQYSGSQIDTTRSFVQHRTMLSINHMTFVRSNSIGYLTFQGGLNNVKETISSNDPNFHSKEFFQPATFAYRIGYGVQYYPTGGRWGIALEAGYGGGAYGRAGIFCWVF